MRVLDRLQDTPAQIMTGLGETLVQTPPARAIFGDETRHTGMARAFVYRWFTDPTSRGVYPDEDHDEHSRTFTANARALYAREGPGSPTAAIVDALLVESAEFAELWSAHEVGGAHSYEKRLQHPEIGVVTVQCQKLLDPDQDQLLLVFTATPGTESYEKLQLLAVIATA
jgi:hypothetical protein